jgi:hypothetical protein
MGDEFVWDRVSEPVMAEHSSAAYPRRARHTKLFNDQ